MSNVLCNTYLRYNGVTICDINLTKLNLVEVVWQNTYKSVLNIDPKLIVKM